MGCGTQETEQMAPSTRAEEKIAGDLMQYGAEIDDTYVVEECQIIKRATDIASGVDTVYVKAHVRDAVADQVCQYKMIYGRYNEGWMLDLVEGYEEDAWVITPLDGASEEMVQRHLPKGAALLSNTVDLEAKQQTLTYRYVEQYQICTLTRTEALRLSFDTALRKWLKAGDIAVADVQEDWQLAGKWTSASSPWAMEVIRFESPAGEHGTMQLTVKAGAEEYEIEAGVLRTTELSEELNLSDAAALLGFRLDYCVRQDGKRRQGRAFCEEFPYVVDVSPVKCADGFLASDGSILGDSLQSNFAEEYEKAGAKIFIGYDGVAVPVRSYFAQSGDVVTIELEILEYQGESD